MNPASPRGILAKFQKRAPDRASKNASSSTADLKTENVSNVADKADRTLRKKSRKDGKKSRQWKPLVDIKKVDQFTLKSVDLPGALKSPRRVEVLCFDSVQGLHDYREAERWLDTLSPQTLKAPADVQLVADMVAEPRSAEAQADVPVDVPVDIPVDVPVQLPVETAPIPTKFNVVLLGHVHPFAFYDEFKLCLDEFCDHETPQNLNVGMTFAHLTQLVNSIFGQVSAEDIGGRIEGISNYLLPSLSSLFAKLEKQLVAGATLNITAGFKSGLLQGLVMFDQAWQGLNALATSMDPDYQSRSLFGGDGPQGYLDNQWQGLERYARFAKATIQIQG